MSYCDKRAGPASSYEQSELETWHVDSHHLQITKPAIYGRFCFVFILNYSYNYIMKNKNWLIILFTLLFLIITLLVVNHNSFVINTNNSVKTFIEIHQSPSINTAMLSITKIGNLYEASIIFLVFALFLLLKNRKSFYIFTLATILGTILPWIIKLLTQIQRPSLLIEHDLSFPSGHATISTIFLLSGIFLISPLIKNRFSKNIFIFIVYIIFPLVAFSRIYISAHWLSDVIAGVILGLISFVFAKKCANICEKRP